VTKGFETASAQQRDRMRLAIPYSLFAAFMTIDSASELCRNALMLALVISLPMMLAALLTGLLISIGQAVTQLQEQTLSFVPKLVVMLLVLILTLPWLLSQMVEFTVDLFRNIPSMS
jgi:flagellar biosynthesis protein FliQ